MAQIRETRYICDSCGQQFEKKADLRKFDVYQYTASGRFEEDVKTDLCQPCEQAFLKALKPFFGDAQHESLERMAR